VRSNWKARVMAVLGATAALCGSIGEGGRAWAARACSVPAGAHQIALAAGALVWTITVSAGSHPRREYEGCIAGGRVRRLDSDLHAEPVTVRLAGAYVGVLDGEASGAPGQSDELYLVDLRNGRRTPSTDVQDTGDSEGLHYQTGPLVTWAVTRSGWLVYAFGAQDGDSNPNTALEAQSFGGVTTLDLAGIRDVRVTASTVSWTSSALGAQTATLGGALLPHPLSASIPSACTILPARIATDILGALSSTPAPSLTVPPAGFPVTVTGTAQSSCAYEAAANPKLTLDVAVQTLTPAQFAHENDQLSALADGGVDSPVLNELVLQGAQIVCPSTSTATCGMSGRTELRLLLGNRLEIDIVTASSQADGDLEALAVSVKRALGVSWGILSPSSVFAQ